MTAKLSRYKGFDIHVDDGGLFFLEPVEKDADTPEHRSGFVTFRKAKEAIDAFKKAALKRQRVSYSIPVHVVTATYSRALHVSVAQAFEAVWHGINRTTGNARLKVGGRSVGTGRNDLFAGPVYFKTLAAARAYAEALNTEYRAQHESETLLRAALKLRPVSSYGVVSIERAMKLEAEHAATLKGEDE